MSKAITAQALKLGIKPEHAEALDERIALLLTDNNNQYTEQQAQTLAARQIIQTNPQAQYVRATHYSTDNHKTLCGSRANRQHLTQTRSAVTCQRCLKQLQRDTV